MADETGKVVQTLERIEQRLVSMERWLRFANMDRLREILSQEIVDDDRKKLAYEHSDGSRGYREVGQMAGVPGPTVQSWWGRWLTIGIMEPSPYRAGRVQRICSLKEVGFDIPSTTVQSKKVNSRSTVEAESAVTERS